MCNLSSDPLSYIKYRHRGYLHNQILLTSSRLIRSDDLSKNSSSINFSLPFVLVMNCVIVGNSTTSNQLGLSVRRYEFMVFVWIHGSFDGVDLGEYCRNLLKIDYAVLIMVLGSGTTVTGSWMPWCARQFHCAHRLSGSSWLLRCVKKREFVR